MGALVAFAKPFRMPDFFLISGLFLARVIDRDWPDYLDKKVVHFAYFYVIWVTIQFAFKAPAFAAELGWDGVAREYAFSFIEPFGTLWFIYLLPICFVVTKALRDVPMVHRLARRSLPASGGRAYRLDRDRRVLRASRLLLFGLRVCALRVRVRRDRTCQPARRDLLPRGVAVMLFGGYAEVPLIGLGCIGAMAVVAISVLLSTVDWARPPRFAGENSITVYLAFFLPMAKTRIALLNFAPALDLGAVAVIVTAIGVVTPLVFFLAVRNTKARYLFKRPAWAHLAPARRQVLAPAE